MLALPMFSPAFFSGVINSPVESSFCKRSSIVSMANFILSEFGDSYQSGVEDDKRTELCFTVLIGSLDFR